MNYYPFHVGDFAAHTSHLTWEEDIAYRRMLDSYYLHEKALPPDMAKVARLIRMPKSTRAVEAVLNEFFTLAEDGWHNKRADAELTLMLSKQEQQSTKDAHEAERMRRHRDRRAELFAALRTENIVPAWDVPMKELQRLYDANCNGTATDLQREQVQNGDAAETAIPIPIPIPIPKEKTNTARKRAAPVALVSVDDMVAEGVAMQHATDWLVNRKTKGLAPLTPSIWQETKDEAGKAGLQISDAIRKAAAEGWGGFKARWLQGDSFNGAPVGADVFEGIH